MAHTITRWEPFAELADIRSRFDRLIGEFADGRERQWTPAVDVVREDGQLVIRAEVPGIAPDEIEVEVDRRALTISGQHEERTEEKDENFVHRERRYGAFSRTIALPEGVDAKKVEATIRDGVLEVRVPLPEERQPEPVKITPTPAA